MVYYFLTYATESYKYQALSLAKTAKTIANFDFTEIAGSENLDEDFKNKNVAILNKNKGAGYWLWKPYVILEKLKKIDLGEKRELKRRYILLGAFPL